MSIGPEYEHPVQGWCYWCGRAMRHYHTPYEERTLHGYVLVCGTCAKTRPDAKQSNWEKALIGHHDTRRWKHAKRGK
jgi:hypothetical protein